MNCQQCVLQADFLTALAVLGSIGGILKLACRPFLGSVVSNVFNIGEVGLPGSMGDYSGGRLVFLFSRGPLEGGLEHLQK